jgi:lipoprotein-anchoring transpeptidase ErfK/SrfK
MTDKPDNARQLLEQARIALQYNDRQAARRLAQQATRADPGLKDAWLLMAELSHDSAKRAYLEQAARLAADLSTPLAVERNQVTYTQSKSTRVTPDNSNFPSQVSSLPPVGPKPKRSYLFPILAVALLSLITIVALLAWILLPVQQTVSAVDHSSQRVVGNLLKPSLTPTNTPEPTLTATATFTPEPTLTETPEVASTSIYQIPALIPTPEIPENVSGSERWIDVDLTKQRTYAFEGDILIRTFIVSTGTQYYPTVTGQYYIYVKYRYDDMSGPGYYLPDVPYTMYFYKGYSLHGTYWHSNFGVPMSHGCVNLSIPDSEWLFNWASVGTLVNIHY